MMRRSHDHKLKEENDAQRHSIKEYLRSNSPGNLITVAIGPFSEAGTLQMSNFIRRMRAPVVLIVLALSVVSFSGPISVQEEESELARANRAIANPLTNNTLFIPEFHTFRLNGTLAEAIRGAMC